MDIKQNHMCDLLLQLPNPSKNNGVDIFHPHKKYFSKTDVKTKSSRYNCVLWNIITTILKEKYENGLKKAAGFENELFWSE